MKVLVIGSGGRRCLERRNEKVEAYEKDSWSAVMYLDDTEYISLFRA